jgi:hypothetical protein
LTDGGPLRSIRSGLRSAQMIGTEARRPMVRTETLLCARCGGPADGWKCAICGSVASEHDAGHLHAGSDRYCTLKCAGCQEADVHCTCV